MTDEEREAREEVIGWYSDAYKEANGFRPRGDLSHLTTEQIEDAALYFQRVANEEAEARRRDEEEDRIAQMRREWPAKNKPGLLGGLQVVGRQ